jgi:hypothetical protein
MQSSAGILALGQIFYYYDIIVMFYCHKYIAWQAILHRSIKAADMADGQQSR